jgi:glycosyltransferase involved in cell wall biosynthesis
MSEERALRILFLSTEYPPETGWGGIGTYTYNMARALAHSGHEVHVLSVALPQQERHYRDGEVFVHRMGQRDLWRLRRLRSAPMPIPHLEKALSTYLAYRRLGIQFDVIEYPEWSAEGLLFSIRQKQPTVVHLHISLPLNTECSGLRKSALTRFAGYLEGLSIRRANVITSPSAALARWTSRYFGLADRIIAIIPHPVPLQAEIPGVASVEALGQTKVLFVGRLDSRKNPEVIVRAATAVRRMIPSAEFVFVGANTGFRKGLTCQDWLTSLAEAAGVATHVHFTGHLSRGEVDAWYKAASVVVAPTRWENFPYVVVEAMMAGRPIVASRVGGIPEILCDRQTGWLVDPDDTEGWAESLIALLTDPERARQMGVRAREDAIDRFDPAKIAAQRETIYREAIRLHERQGNGQQDDRYSCL